MGLYIVRRDRWYTERMVWGLAGVVIFTGTALAGSVHPAFIGLVTFTGLFSLITAFTGVCFLSTALSALGFPSFLGSTNTLYRMRTDSWYLERGIYVVVGTTQTLGSILSVIHSPNWLWFTGFVGAMAVAFSFSGFCPVANALYFLGFEPRLLPTNEEAISGVPSLEA